jgi:hypothetical protein
MLTLAMACTLWAFARYDAYGTGRSKTVLAICLCFLAVTHPLGGPIVFGWVISETIPPLSTAGRRLFDSRLVPRLALVSPLALLPHAIQRRNLLSRWYIGEVVANDPTYAIPVEETSSLAEFLVSNHVLVVAIPIARVTLFFVPWFPRNSLARIAVNTATYLPILLVACYGAYLAWDDRPDLVRYLVTPAVVMLGVTALLFVSWDLRYRAVLGPPMAMLVGYVAFRLSLVDRVLSVTGIVSSERPSTTDVNNRTET